MAEILNICILVIVISGFLAGQVISFLNHRSRKNPVPPVLEGVYSPDRYQQYLLYKSDSFRFGMLISWLSFIATLVMLLGGFVLIDDFVRSVFQNPILQSLLFFGIIGLAADLLSTPFDLYDTFVIEQKYGFNKSTPAIYISDKLKSWFLAAVIGGGLISLIVWLYTLLGNSFWWLAWISISSFSIFFSLFYSSIIVPLFNRQTPLEPGDLRNKLNDLAVRTGFDLTDIFIIDGSKRSTRANAYFSGFGSKRRIVLYDTLIQNQTPDQITAVLAHEIGHYRKKHTIKTLVLSIVQTGVILFLFSVVVGNPDIYLALGSSGNSFHLGLIVFMILYSPISSITSVITNYLSRMFEFQADRFAVENADPLAMASSLRLLTSDNLSDLTPHPWHVFLNYTHPPLDQRLERILKNSE
ncbi:MAG: M48 family metallopeptidase [Bacteroidales bacterium]|nr:M48 family metallopeptidase [Bacteroidales bacterium]